MKHDARRLELDLEEIECPSINRRRLIFISGPCSAESETQVIATARELAEWDKLAFFRAGLWKARSRDGSFEGVGASGLPWLQRVRKETGLMVGTEVASAAHVKACRRAGIDFLWLGARTVTNPFSVQEIAKALKGSTATVMVKNPVTPDLQLWIGALERINREGVRKLGAIHRGFTPYGETVFRNAPRWSLPFELKILCPKLPIICDPSHIGGRREFVRALSQKAMDLDMNGLMIEAHVDPPRALSDAAQQLRPREVHDVLSHLVIRRKADLGSAIQLKHLRQQIDEIDAALIQYLSQRMNVVKRIGAYKREENLLIFQARRWAEVLRENKKLGRRAGLRDKFVHDLWQIIHQEAVEIQDDLKGT